VPALANNLRGNGPAALRTMVVGPVVLLDMKTGVITTLCGNAAAAATQDWGLKLADASRRSPSCFAGTSAPPQVVCSQNEGSDLLHLEFDRPDQPRLMGVMVGSPPAGQSLAALFHQFTDQMATASCP
jgi:hypothetical protein